VPVQDHLLAVSQNIVGIAHDVLLRHPYRN
jgi:hypothetical protein